MPSACDHCMPVTTGTRVVASPVETVIVTFEPFDTCVPADGFCSMILPRSTFGDEPSRTTGSRSKPFFFKIADASAVVFPDRSGTDVFSRPDDTVTVIVEPLFTVEFAVGSVPTT